MHLIKYSRWKSDKGSNEKKDNKISTLINIRIFQEQVIFRMSLFFSATAAVTIQFYDVLNVSNY